MSSVENSPVAGQVGRKLILSGAILMGLSVLLGLVGTKLTLGQFSTAQLTREVVINGSPNPKVPGKLSFEVSEPLQETSAQDAEMHVGIAVAYEQLPAPVCTMTNESGAEVPLKSSGSGEALLGDNSGKFTVMGSALLAPGEYEAICTLDEEPSSSSASFTVGRVFGMDDLSGTFAPFLWFLAVGFVCGLMFLVGLILMIVGLVKRSKSNKSGLGLPTAGVSGSAPAPGVPAVGAYSDIPAAREPPPAWPGPHAPGPPQAAPGAPPAADPPAGPPTEPPSGPPSPPSAPPADPGAPPSGWTVPPSKLR
ncbi:hypothetical protein IMCC26207_109300 [Actinobacteria bacterium IMCC26207]|nr:hypothetical protein IMCC26207_109300 [Actinobacteria bacterium IMCC26207]